MFCKIHQIEIKSHRLTAVWRNGEKSAKFTFIFRKKYYLYQKICSYEVRHCAKQRHVGGNHLTIMRIKKRS